MRKPFPREVKLSNMEEIGQTLSHEIRRSHLNFKQLSKATGLATSTISRMCYRETRFPRIQTIIALFEHFGYIIIAHPVYLQQSNVHILDVKRA